MRRVSALVKLARRTPFFPTTSTMNASSIARRVAMPSGAAFAAVAAAPPAAAAAAAARGICFRAAAAAPPPPPAPSSLLLRRSRRSAPPTLPSRRAAVSSASSATAATSQSEPETFQYQAEVDRLMDMIVNSLYSNRDVFLRELVSNASDALDKARFNAITDGKDAGELRIRVRADAESKTIEIEDTGVGMTRDEMLSSLGTIARSGTAKFAEAVKEANGDAALIGQFGVGFYSAFLVADRVTVTSRSSAGSDDGGKAWQWESSAGSHQYSIKAVDGTDGADPNAFNLERGTRVTLHLKDDAAELADAAKLSQLLKQYSEFISFPIELWTSKTVYDDVVDDEATKRAQEAADAKAKEEGKDSAEPVKPVMTSKPRVEFDWVRQNDSAPLWTRAPRDVGDGEYNQFFKTTFKEFLDPLAVAHFNVEGTIEFTALLYVPSMPPFEQQDWLKPSRNVKLFVKRVFISDEFDEDLLPRWASFVRGVVDSADLPLNVSREILQESRVVRTIRRQLVKRTVEMLKEIAARPKKEGGGPSGAESSDYETFWAAFGKFIKLGAIEDQANRDNLAPLLRFASSHAGSGSSSAEAAATTAADENGDDASSSSSLTSLDDYVSRMKAGQKGIFYIAADSLQAAAGAPFVERLVQKGYEVLYLTEPIDEPSLNALGSYSGHDFVDVTREGLELGDDEEEKLAKEKAEKAEKGELKPLLDAIAKALGPERVEKASVSTRLAGSPCALVTSKFGWSAYQERVMRAQAMGGDARAAEYMKGKKTFEVNPDHPVIKALAKRVSSGSDGGGGEFDADGKRAVELLYDAALVTSGFTVESPREFASRIFDMIGLAVGGGGEGGSGGGGDEKEVEVV